MVAAKGREGRAHGADIAARKPFMTTSICRLMRISWRENRSACRLPVGKHIRASPTAVSWKNGRDLAVLAYGAASARDILPAHDGDRAKPEDCVIFTSLYRYHSWHRQSVAQGIQRFLHHRTRSASSGRATRNADRRPGRKTAPSTKKTDVSLELRVNDSPRR